MLRLENINKQYVIGDMVVDALKDLSLDFPSKGFVSILGPSGCGKTTLLNLIGGLDVYTSGNLIINGKSTKDFKQSDWDAYRNKSIGFVFQSYNLISHQNVLQNVELALTLSGVSDKERKARATSALEKVGLLDQIKKKPNQLSGGQMQRVAIARALVNNPDIILADEPTGALDSETSVSIMNILREISDDKLIIMVTHNAEIATEYSSRIIRLKDGSVVSDENQQEEQIEQPQKTEIKDEQKREKRNKTSMSFLTALKLSFKNLTTKKVRTFITSFAGSIGIIGVALVLAISNGFSNQISDLQSNGLAGFPITIAKNPVSIPTGPPEGVDSEEFPDTDKITSFDYEKTVKAHTNIITDEYIKYVEKMDKSLVNTISFSKSVEMNILTKSKDNVVMANKSTKISPIMTQQTFFELPDSEEFITSLYDVVAGKLPTKNDELVLVISKENLLTKVMIEKLGFELKDNKFSYNDAIGKEYKIVLNNDFYVQKDNKFFPSPTSEYKSLYENKNSKSLKIVGILRVNKDASSEIFGEGIGYLPSLTTLAIENAKNSNVAKAQLASETSVLGGVNSVLDKNTKKDLLQTFGADETPANISIYPKDFDSKSKIRDYLDDYNKGKNETTKIVYSDLAQSITGIFDTIISTISIVLIAFAGISLVVSSIMIGIITYVSVLERTKEIGILRSIGARKKDISRVFNAETIIVGAVAGLIGVTIAYLITIPINIVVENLVPTMKNVADLTPQASIILILISISLTFVAGLIPSRIAANKNPVVALRTE